MVVREWQNTLVNTYTEAVKDGDMAVVKLAAHNLAVHIATSAESMDMIKLALIHGAVQQQPVHRRQGMLDDSDPMEAPFGVRTGLITVHPDEQAAAGIPWPPAPYEVEGPDCHG